jgi:hypothetical protein
MLSRLLLADAAPLGRGLRLALEVLGLTLVVPRRAGAGLGAHPAGGRTSRRRARRLSRHQPLDARERPAAGSALAGQEGHPRVAAASERRIASGSSLSPGMPGVVCPLTHDFGAFEGLLDAVDTRTTRLGGTDLGAALRAALALLPREGAPSQAIVILTDGEDLAGQGAAGGRSRPELGECACTRSVMAASREPRSPGRESGEVMRDENGQIVVSRLDAQGLRQLTGAAAGTYLGGNDVSLPLVELFDKRVRAHATAQLRARRAEHATGPLSVGADPGLRVAASGLVAAAAGRASLRVSATRAARLEAAGTQRETAALRFDAPGDAHDPARLRRTRQRLRTAGSCRTRNVLGSEVLLVKHALAKPGAR